MLSKALSLKKKNSICQIFHQKNISESFDENLGNGGRFSKFVQFCETHIFDFSAT
jgi:hypothetical protein